MKKLHAILILFFSLLPGIALCQPAWTTYSSEVSFKIKNAGLTVTGRFSGLTTSLFFSPDKLSSSSLKGTVEVATIKTGIDKRDKDLLEEKYFDAEKYKSIEIKSTKLYNKGHGYAGLFNVTIKGVTKQVEIPFEFKQTGKDGEFKSGFTINRKDFGVGGNSMIMGDDVKVTIDIKAKEE
jgi:polyisoprenoid-binding protein YceI